MKKRINVPAVPKPFHRAPGVLKHGTNALNNPDSLRWALLPYILAEFVHKSYLRWCAGTRYSGRSITMCLQYRNRSRRQVERWSTVPIP